jgi:hypothetical protein
MFKERHGKAIIPWAARKSRNLLELFKVSPAVQLQANIPFFTINMVEGGSLFNPTQQIPQCLTISAPQCKIGSATRASPSGKASAFQADIRRFESGRPLFNA